MNAIINQYQINFTYPFQIENVNYPEKKSWFKQLGVLSVIFCF